jgi:LTXXQ motif family protein
MSSISYQFVRFAAAVAVSVLMSSSAIAQQQPPSGGPGRNGWGADMMMGPGMMRSGRLGFMCNPRSAGMAQWRLDRIETELKPNDTQKAALKELRAASAKAAETLTAACAAAMPAKSVERMALMEKRLEASLQVVRTVRPAFEAFYVTLDEQQKAKLDATGPRAWGWRAWHWPWSQ